MRKIVMFLAAAVVVLSGCSSDPEPPKAPQIDEAAFKADALNAGWDETKMSWSAYVAHAKRVCAMNDRTFELYLAHNVDDGLVHVTATMVEHVCPERYADVVPVLQEVANG